MCFVSDALAPSDPTRDPEAFEAACMYTPRAPVAFRPPSLADFDQELASLPISAHATEELQGRAERARRRADTRIEALEPGATPARRAPPTPDAHVATWGLICVAVCARRRQKERP